VTILQELYKKDPWKLLVGCILLNKTSRKQVDRVRDELFQKWPTPQHLALASPTELEALLKPLGLHRQRTRTLKRFSEDWLSLMERCEYFPPGHGLVAQLHGVGKYALDSYRIFVEGDLHGVGPEDSVLREYLGLSPL